MSRKTKAPKADDGWREYEGDDQPSEQNGLEILLSAGPRVRLRKPRKGDTMSASEFNRAAKFLAKIPVTHFSAAQCDSRNAEIQLELQRGARLSIKRTKVGKTLIIKRGTVA